MTNAKITLPSEVIEAIEELRGLEFTNADIIVCAASSTQPHTVTTYTLYEWASANKSHDILMQALVNGYTVAKSPKELVREYYEGLKRAEEHAVRNEHSGSQHRQGWQSVAKTLDLLGIKISGVNA